MSNEENDIHQKLELIKLRKKERERKEKLRLACFGGVATVVAVAGIFAVRGVAGYIKSKRPLPPPEPVNLMTYNPQEEVPNIEKENFVYAEPVSTPSTHIFSGQTDRLEEIKARGGKACYLTFDDGPNLSITPQILDILRRYDVKATFFQVGTLIESNADMARRVYEEGHLLANHSYSHNYKNLYSSPEEFMSEIKKTEELIKERLNSEDEFFPLIRFPGGSFNSGKYKDMKQAIKQNLAESEYYYCDWNSLNGDAEGKRKNAEDLVEYFKKNTNVDKPAVVLMHDTVSKQSTVDALPGIIEYMMENGYTFLRLDEDI